MQGLGCLRRSGSARRDRVAAPTTDFYSADEVSHAGVVPTTRSGTLRVSALRIAVIANIHGNLPALEAALDDIERHNVDRTINLGDCVSGPLWPCEVCDLLMASHDRWVSV